MKRTGITLELNTPYYYAVASSDLCLGDSLGFHDSVDEAIAIALEDAELGNVTVITVVEITLTEHGVLTEPWELDEHQVNNWLDNQKKEASE